MTGLTTFLDEQRAAILRKLDGLSDIQAASTPTASSLSLLTIVKHLAYVERRWFELRSPGGTSPGSGRPTIPPRRPSSTPVDDVTSIRGLYERTIAESRPSPPQWLGPTPRAVPTTWV